ncbi:MAG: glycosyltransferase, partial [Nitrosopumilaceae archaeon]|nr:glycosyltransferase family 2 protein [Nitrosopumilaceae archaeon]NIX60191.1 glycosyltransferase [Nitrosopumilaceae archaeon]
MKKKKLISIIVPVYNESEVIEAFYKRVREVIYSLSNYAYEIIFVDDGSKDGSYQNLVNLADFDRHVEIIKFSRNFGHQTAITAGMDHSKGDAVVIIDADLQDPPEVIKKFIDKWQEGYDVVFGIRERREGESRIKLFTASSFYRLLKRIAKIDIPIDVGD